jgi:hypothetical protein
MGGMNDQPDGAAELRQKLFKAVEVALDAERTKDESLVFINRTPAQIAVSRFAHALQMDRGDGRALMRGVIRWAWTPDGDRPFRFTVSRSVNGEWRMNPGKVGTLQDVVGNIVTTFMAQSLSAAPPV